MTGTTILLAGRITDKYREELLAEADKFGVRQRIRIPGALPPTEIGALYGMASVYLSASTHEGRSNAVLEALATGIPVCLADIPGHRELVEDTVNGFLFSDNAPQQAARQIEELLSNSALWKEISSKAQSSVESLTWQASAKKYRALYEGTIR